MSAATDYRQILQGGEQANQAVAWDWMVGNSDPIEGRVAPSGQTWAVIAGGENKVQVTGTTMRLKAGSEDDTVYPYLVSPTNITVIGAEIEFVAAGGATDDAAGVMIIAQSTNIADFPFLHLTFSAFGNAQLEWYAAGLNGGVTASTSVNGAIVLSQTYTIEAMVETNGTVTFITPYGTLRLTGLTIPGNLVYGMWEFTSPGADLKNSLRYHKVWLNPIFANMMGQTTQPYSGILDKLAGGRATTLNAVTITSGGDITLAAGKALHVPTHASFTNGGVIFLNAAGTAEAMCFGLGGDNQGFWNMPSGGNMHLYNNAGNILLYRWIASSGDFEVSFGKLLIATAHTPATAGAAGVTGQWAWDTGFLYVCTATNTWKRVAIATW